MTRYGWENMVPEFIYRYLYLYKPYMDMNKCILLYTNRMFVLLTFLFWNI